MTSVFLHQMRELSFNLKNNHPPSYILPNDYSKNIQALDSALAIGTYTIILTKALQSLFADTILSINRDSICSALQAEEMEELSVFFKIILQYWILPLKESMVAVVDNPSGYLRNEYQNLILSSQAFEWMSRIFLEAKIRLQSRNILLTNAECKDINDYFKRIQPCFQNLDNLFKEIPSIYYTNFGSGGGNSCAGMHVIPYLNWATEKKEPLDYSSLLDVLCVKPFSLVRKVSDLYVRSKLYQLKIHHRAKEWWVTNKQITLLRNHSFMFLFLEEEDKKEGFVMQSTTPLRLGAIVLTKDWKKLQTSCMDKLWVKGYSMVRMDQKPKKFLCLGF